MLSPRQLGLIGKVLVPDVQNSFANGAEIRCLSLLPENLLFLFVRNRRMCIA
jgi:hypothetical protein